MKRRREIDVTGNSPSDEITMRLENFRGAAEMSRRLRAALKYLLRGLHLRCTSFREVGSKSGTNAQGLDI
jgi:hypothetical protein